MRDKQRKKAQKKISTTIHEFNKSLLNDPLWRGRFYIHQTDAIWDRFCDGSGGVLITFLEVRDKKTGLYHAFDITNYYPDWDLYQEVNDFIINDSHVWDNIDEVKNDKTNWEKVKWVRKVQI